MKAITTKINGPTDTPGTRIVATDGDGNRVSVPYDHALNPDQNHRVAMETLCRKLGWHGEIAGGTLMQSGREIGMVWVWTTDNTYEIDRSVS